MSAPLLRIVNVRKAFGNVAALRGVSFDIDAASVTCLLGDNGAGKSTLIRVLSGVHRADDGLVLLDGRPTVFRSPRDARAAGVATVHQELALLPLMSVWRNFVLGAEPTCGAAPFRRIDVGRARAMTTEGLARLGVSLEDIDRPVATLSGGQRQAVAIARALADGARILILDEPTAALGVRQTRLVLDAIDAARSRGIAVILITHNPRHAYPVGDRYVVLRQGEVARVESRDETSVEALAELMGG